MLPDSIKRFVDLFAALPAIGPRLATRLAFYLARQSKGFIHELSRAIAGLAETKTCAECFFPYEVFQSIGGKGSLCRICADSKRSQNVIAVVEKETDLISIEKSKKFAGRYLVLGDLGRDGVLDTEQKLRLTHLKNTTAKRFGQAEEIILALNPTTLGNMEASLITQELKPIAKKITRLGRGLPTGGEIEFADEDTLAGALQNRG